MTRKFSFSDLRMGMRAKVLSVDCSAEGADRLMELGLTSGAIFEVIKVAPFGDPVEICLRGYRLCLRKDETKYVEIERLPDF